MNEKRLKFVNKLNINLKKIYCLLEDVRIACDFDNQFTIKINENKEIILIYINKKKEIILYNLNKKEITLQKPLSEIQNTKNPIFLKYCYDYISKYELLLILIHSNSLKNQLIIYKYKTLEKLAIIKELHKSLETVLFTCISTQNLSNYIISCCSYDQIKIFNFKGELKNYETLNKRIYFLDIFFIKLKYYVIVGTNDNLYIYNFPSLEVFHILKDDLNDSEGHINVILRHNKKKIELIESDYNGLIRIWDFASGNLIKYINFNVGLLGFCLLCNNYILIGSADCTIKLFDLDDFKKISCIKIHNNDIISVKNIQINNTNYIISLSWDKRFIIWK